MANYGRSGFHLYGHSGQLVQNVWQNGKLSVILHQKTSEVSPMSPFWWDIR